MQAGVFHVHDSLSHLRPPDDVEIPRMIGLERLLPIPATICHNVHVIELGSGAQSCRASGEARP